jgi:hypothetical protein
MKASSFFSLALVALVSVSALANRACLEGATNNELLNEISFRMNSRGPVIPVRHVPYTIVSICHSGILKLEVINRQTLQSYPETLDFTHRNSCEAGRSYLTRTLGNSLRVAPQHFAVCVGSILVKFAASSNGLAITEREDFTHTSSCAPQANHFNENMSLPARR